MGGMNFIRSYVRSVLPIIHTLGKRNSPPEIKERHSSSSPSPSFLPSFPTKFLFFYYRSLKEKKKKKEKKTTPSLPGPGLSSSVLLYLYSKKKKKVKIRILASISFLFDIAYLGPQPFHRIFFLGGFFGVFFWGGEGNSTMPSIRKRAMNYLDRLNLRALKDQCRKLVARASFPSHSRPSISRPPIIIVCFSPSAARFSGFPRLFKKRTASLTKTFHRGAPPTFEETPIPSRA